jgi:PKD repeat protein
MIPVDLTGLTNPSLTFEMAHAEYDASYVDGMRIEVFTDCDLGGAPVTIWEKYDPDLATVPSQTTSYVPGSGADWRRESVDLSAFAGQKIIARFVSINGYGNNLYIDDLGINPLHIPTPPVAAFSVADTVCRLDTVVFQATPSTTDAFYTWSFGLGANPNTASGIGPHSVVYPTAGNKTVRLIVSNDDGKDTMVQVVNVRQLATANFTATQNQLTVTFNNTSTNATSYLWDFGDGMTSTIPSPSHTYAAPGTYTVSLSATNACRTHVKTSTFGTTEVNELSDRIEIRILPNPTEGDFAAELDSRINGNVQCTLTDAAGRKVNEQKISIKQGINRVTFENLNLPKGLYQLNIQTEGKQATFVVVVQ